MQHGSRNMAAAAAKLPPTSKVNSKFDISLQICYHAIVNFILHSHYLHHIVYILDFKIPNQFEHSISYKLMLQKISDFIKSELQSMLKNRQQSQQQKSGGFAPRRQPSSLRGAPVAKCKPRPGKTPITFWLPPEKPFLEPWSAE